MPSLLMKDGHLVMRSGALVTTENPADCDCCNPCGGCCGSTMPQWATITFTDIAEWATDASDCDCLAWNTSFEVPLINDGGTCKYRLDDGVLPCGVHPRLELTVSPMAPCEPGVVQEWQLNLMFDRTGATSAQTVRWHYSPTVALSDCEAYWAGISAGFDMFRGAVTGTDCNWGPFPDGYTANVVLHD